MFCGDESDPPETDIYHPGGVYKYPYADEAYFMFPWVYEHWPESPHPNDGRINAQFAAWSRKRAIRSGATMWRTWSPGTAAPTSQPGPAVRCDCR